MKYIIAIGIFQALAAAVLLWRSRIRNRADDLLIALLVCIFLHLSIKFFIYSAVVDTEILGMMNTFVWFSYLPLLYLYTIKTIRHTFVPAAQWYVFIPLIVGAICFFSVVSVLATSAEDGHYVLSWYNSVSLWTIISLDVILASWIIIHANKKLKQKSTERRLIIQIASLFLAISLLSLVFVLFKPFGADHNYIGRSIIYTLLIIICIRIITYRYSAFVNLSKENGVVDVRKEFYEEIVNSIDGTPQNESIAEKKLQIEKLTSSVSASLPVRDRKELLSIDEMLSIVLKLETAMTTQAYFKDSELTLDKLSVLTSHKKYHVSETLNHYLHKPFYTYINEYRVQYVKEKINHLSKKEIEINMLSLAYDAGFNSKSSFNRYFKELVGQTPTAYLKMVTQQLEIA